jgi:hypothetical protein
MKKWLFAILAGLGTLASILPAGAEQRPTCFFSRRDDGEMRALLSQIAASQQQILANQQMILSLLQRQQTAPSQPQVIVLGPGQGLPATPPRLELPATPPKLDIPITPPRLDLPANPPPKIELPATPPRQELPATPPRQPQQVQTYMTAIWRPASKR